MSDAGEVCAILGRDSACFKACEGRVGIGRLDTDPILPAGFIGIDGDFVGIAVRAKA
jgi:hypothetical protein